MADIESGPVTNINQIPTRNHNDLQARDAASAHPESAITNLITDLDAKVAKSGDTMTSTLIIDPATDVPALQIVPASDTPTTKFMIQGRNAANDADKFTVDNAGNIVTVGTVDGVDVSEIPRVFSRGGSLYNPDGIPDAALNIMIWRAPFACTVTNVYGFISNGTNTTINARKNGTSNHISPCLCLTSSGTFIGWTGTIDDPTYGIGDTLEIMVVNNAGASTQIAIQVDYTI